MKTRQVSSPCYEKVTSSPDECFSVEEVVGAELRCIYHYHPEYELACIAAGQGNVLIGSSLEAFGPGHCALIGPNIPHYYVSARPRSGGELSRSRVIKFSADCLGEGFFDRPDMAQVRQLLDLSRHGVRFLPTDAQRLECLAEELFAASGSRRTARFLGLLCELAVCDRRLLLDLPYHANPNDVYSARINLAIDYINLHLKEKLTVGEVSRVAMLSSATFGRHFYRIMQKTFSQYLIELRLGLACGLLQNTSASVAEVCYDSGFTNLSNFNRMFLKKMRVTPRKYRNNLHRLTCP